MNNIFTYPDNVQPQISMIVIIILCYHGVCLYLCHCSHRISITGSPVNWSGDFCKVILGLIVPSGEYDAYSIRNAVKGPGTDETALIQILSSSTNAEMHEMKLAYSRCKYIYLSPSLPLPLFLHLSLSLSLSLPLSNLFSHANADYRRVWGH